MITNAYRWAHNAFNVNSLWRISKHSSANVNMHITLLSSNSWEYVCVCVCVATQAMVLFLYGVVGKSQEAVQKRIFHLDSCSWWGPPKKSIREWHQRELVSSNSIWVQWLNWLEINHKKSRGPSQKNMCQKLCTLYSIQWLENLYICIKSYFFIEIFWM